MAEVLLNHIGKGRFRAFSAGSHPRGSVHSLALETLRRSHLPVEGLRSKSWDEFALPGAPQLDFVFTVCDRAAQEICPMWPGQPMTAHWGIEDPALAAGTADQQQRAFNLAFRALDARLRLFTSLPIESLDSLALQRQLDSIGRLRTGD
jgi:arsenate reductase